MESEFNLKVTKKVLYKMSWVKPKYYSVFKPWLQLVLLRDGELKQDYSHGVHRGFYAKLAAELKIAENTVRYRKRAAVIWFYKHLQIEINKYKNN